MGLRQAFAFRADNLRKTQEIPVGFSESGCENVSADSGEVWLGFRGCKLWGERPLRWRTGRLCCRAGSWSKSTGRFPLPELPEDIRGSNQSSRAKQELDSENVAQVIARLAGSLT